MIESGGNSFSTQTGSSAAIAEIPLWSPSTPTLSESLFANGCDFEFFQAVSILESIYHDRLPVGMVGRRQPAVRFAARSSSHSFAASSIYDIAPATTINPVAKMTVGFMGLTGPSGILPEHYTELLHRIELEARGPQKYALRDWLDLFNDRLIALFYRGWKKYRPVAFHVQALRGETDDFTCVLQSLSGLGMPSLQHQVKHFVPDWKPPSENTEVDSDTTATQQPAKPAVEDSKPKHAATENPAGVLGQNCPTNLALLRYAGLLSHRPRTASNLKQVLEDYFELDIEIKQFHGNWLTIDESAQTRLGVSGANSILGQNAVVGDQTWERQNKILVIVGPVSQSQFTRLMPDHASEFAENDYRLLVELIRLFVGPEVEFDIQIRIGADSVPPSQICDDEVQGMRLGWNTWLGGGHENELLHDTVFSAD